MDAVRRERDKLLEEREGWQMKSNMMHEREVEEMRRSVERERREMLREREVWQKEMDRMHKVEMEKIMQEKESVMMGE